MWRTASREELPNKGGDSWLKIGSIFDDPQWRSNKHVSDHRRLESGRVGANQSGSDSGEDIWENSDSDAPLKRRRDGTVSRDAKSQVAGSFVVNPTGKVEQYYFVQFVPASLD